MLYKIGLLIWVTIAVSTGMLAFIVPLGIWVVICFAVIIAASVFGTSDNGKEWLMNLDRSRLTKTRIAGGVLFDLMIFCILAFTNHWLLSTVYFANLVMAWNLNTSARKLSRVV